MKSCGDIGSFDVAVVAAVAVVAGAAAVVVGVAAVVAVVAVVVVKIRQTTANTKGRGVKEMQDASLTTIIQCEVATKIATIDTNATTAPTATATQ